MSRSFLPCALCLSIGATAGAAQQFEAAEIDLSFSLRRGEDVDLGAGTVDAVAGWRFGAFGLQLGVQGTGLSLAGAVDDLRYQNALRLIGSYQATPALRFGISATQFSGDYPVETTAIGLHALYRTARQRFEVELNLPPSDDANGLITGVLALEQDFARDITLRALLHRRSTDDEVDDLYAIVLGGEYRFDSGLFAFGELYNTANDNAIFDNTGGLVGIGYRIDDRGELYAALTVKRGDGDPGNGIDGDGITLGARWALGGRAAADGLFRIDPLLDIAGYGAY